MSGITVDLAAVRRELGALTPRSSLLATWPPSGSWPSSKTPGIEAYCAPPELSTSSGTRHCMTSWLARPPELRGHAGVVDPCVEDGPTN